MYLHEYYNVRISILLYICSINIALKIVLMQTINTNPEKITFKDYYQFLEDIEKNRIRDVFVPQYLSYSAFYYKVRLNSFTELELQKLEELTKQSFLRNA